MSNLPEPTEPKPTLDDIVAGIPAVEHVERPDPRDLLERHPAERVQLENDLARSRIKNVESDRAMRENYAGRILLYLETYSFVVGLMVIASGFHIFAFDLPVEIL